MADAFGEAAELFDREESTASQTRACRAKFAEHVCMVGSARGYRAGVASFEQLAADALRRGARHRAKVYMARALLPQLAMAAHGMLGDDDVEAVRTWMAARTALLHEAGWAGTAEETLVCAALQAVEECDAELLSSAAHTYAANAVLDTWAVAVLLRAKRGIEDEEWRWNSPVRPEEIC